MSFGYQFNYSPSGLIVSYNKLSVNGKIERERIDRDENAYRENGLIIIEERDGRDLEWDIFQDTDNDGIWQKVAEGESAAQLDATKQLLTSGTAPVPNVTLVSGPEDTVFKFSGAGKVTHVGEIGRRGKVDYDKVDKDDIFEVRGQFILEQEMERGRADEWSLYHDADRDGIWAEVATGKGAADFDALLVQFAASGIAIA